MNIPTVAEIQALQVQNFERESEERRKGIVQLADEITEFIVKWLKKSTGFPVNIPYIVDNWSFNVQGPMTQVFMIVCDRLEAADSRYILSAAPQSYHDGTKTKYNIIINIK